MFPTVNNCLYFISLRNAGLILGLINIGIEILYFFSGVDSIVMMISMTISMAWIYGIVTDKPILMLPNLFLYAIPVAVPTCTYVLMAVFSDSQSEIVIWLIVSVLLIHFWIVQYSLYKSMVKPTTEGYDESNRNESVAMNSL